jgi:hypothetical protein
VRLKIVALKKNALYGLIRYEYSSEKSIAIIGKVIATCKIAD